MIHMGKTKMYVNRWIGTTHNKERNKEQELSQSHEKQNSEPSKLIGMTILF